MNQRRSFVMSFAVVMLFGLFVFSASAKEAAGGPAFQLPLASIELTAIQPNPARIGEEFVFEMKLSVANIITGVTGADVYLQYDSTLVAPMASPGQPIAEILPDFFGVRNVSVNEIVTCPGGSGSCLHLVVAGPPQVTKTGAIARFHFTGLRDGRACFAVASSDLRDADGYPVTHSRPACASVDIISRRGVTGTITRQGTPGNPNPGGGTLMCSLAKLSNGQSAFTDATGGFVIKDVPPGTYSIEGSYSGYLKAAKSGVIVPSGSAAVDVGLVRLVGGDVNNDCVINIQDIGAIISEFGRSGVPVRSAVSGCAGSDDPNDINDDGIVNIGDLAIAAGNWNKVCPMVWP
jgi:hypothetical protein